MPTAASLLLLSLSQGAIRFLGSPQCPDQAAVEVQLRALDPSVLESSARHLVMLETRADGLQVRLFDLEGRLLEDRPLTGPMSCADWARVVAALLATWETSLAAPALPVPPPAAPPAVPPPAQPETPAQARPRGPRWQGEIGAGFSGSVASDGSGALGGDVLVTLAPPSNSFGGELSFSGTAFRSLSVGDGTARWQRLALGVGGYGTLGTGRLRLQVGAAFLFGLLSINGQGFQQTQSDSVFDPGIGISSRLLWRFAPPVVAWAQIGASFWPKKQQVRVLTGSATADLTAIPPVDVCFTLGFSLAGDL